MKGIILAAGLGSRLGKLTVDLPKCLAISWSGRTLLDAQIEALQSCGITDIIIIRGYQGHKFTRTDVRYCWNTDYALNNILESLICAEKELIEEVLICYSDIWFQETIPMQLIKSNADIAIAVDPNWKKNYAGRTDHPMSEAELVFFDSGFRLRNIGKLKVDHEKANGEFLGMLKLSASGSRTIKNYYNTAKSEFDGKPFQNAPSFKRAYITDLLQYMSDRGIPIECKIINGEWREIDTIQDLERLKSLLSINDE